MISSNSQKRLKIALVHDYLNEFGGAERVLLALSEIWPDAPIYTAFYRENSEAYKRFKGKKIIASWAQNVPFFASKLHSPLRFLAPLIWNSFVRQLADYDVVITSSSWYVTKGLAKRSALKAGPTKEKGQTLGRPIEICYCHTPPRYLYGYATSRKYTNPLIWAYALVVNHFMRVYDYEAAQRVDYFVANSKEVQERIKKFYRRDSVVIYPPVEVERLAHPRGGVRVNAREHPGGDSSSKGYFLIVSRLVGSKGIELAVETFTKLNLPLKVVGTSSGYSTLDERLKEKSGKNIEFLGYVEDKDLADLYSNARAFLALSQDEDFGITPVEAMMCGTSVIAYNGGGYKETVVDGKTGILIDELSGKELTSAVTRFNSMQWNRAEIRMHAQKFNKDRFKREIKRYVESNS